MPTKKKSTTRRKPPAKRVAKKNAVAVVESSKFITNLSSYPLEEVMGWRDNARKRIEANLARIEKLRIQNDKIWREAEKLDKKLHSDLTWCKKLNRTIARKVF